MSEHSIEMKEYPVEYSENLEYDAHHDQFSVVSTDINGNWDTETVFECDCGGEYYSMSEARRHMAEVNE